MCIRDLITSINDEAESTNMASKLLEWTERHNIHIVVILHENPGSDKARGHIGTELTNKAETVITVQIDKYDDDVSIVSAGLCRNKSFKPFAFKITDDGLPKIIEDYDIEMKAKKKGFDVLNLGREDKFQVLEKVFENGERFQHSELLNQIKIVLDKNFNGSKGKVLFIDASKDYLEGKAQNHLRDEDIAKTLATYKDYKTVERYCSVCDLAEIEENDFNLNISRYVDTTEPEVPVIVEDVLKDLGELENQREETNSKLNTYLKELGY